MKRAPKDPSTKDRDALLAVLEARFGKHPQRHPDIAWDEVRARLEVEPGKLRILGEMEDSGGEPDVVGRDAGTGGFVFFDCSPETPKGRVSLCYDRKGWESRKEHRPVNTAIDLAVEMGVELLSEEQYYALQKLGEFDKKTSSWVKTPESIRSQGGALFCDLRYGRVFTGYNGAQSYYAARGFRASLAV